MYYVTISHKQQLTVVSSTKGAANDDCHLGDLGTAGTRQIPSFVSSYKVHAVGGKEFRNGAMGASNQATQLGWSATGADLANSEHRVHRTFTLATAMTIFAPFFAMPPASALLPTMNPASAAFASKRCLGSLCCVCCGLNTLPQTYDNPFASRACARLGQGQKHSHTVTVTSGGQLTG